MKLILGKLNKQLNDKYFNLPAFIIAIRFFKMTLSFHLVRNLGNKDHNFTIQMKIEKRAQKMKRCQARK